jgi:Domain of unknown function (DUF4439)
MSDPVSVIDDEAAAALQNALAAEHAALWCYGLVIAFLASDQLVQAHADETAHATLRGKVEQTLTQIGRKPVTAEPAYAVPEPVTDAASAAALAVVAENDCLVAWRAVVERTTDQGLRSAAVAALTETTLRSAHWRTVVAVAPAVLVFPGQP